MSESESSSIWELSNEWQTKADDVLRSTVAELSRRPQPRGPSPTVPVLRQSAPEEEVDARPTASDLAEIDDAGRRELADLASIPAQQQQLFEAQIAQKNDIWERLVRERREEASGLAAIAARLGADVAGARSRAKSDADEAKRRRARGRSARGASSSSCFWGS